MKIKFIAGLLLGSLSLAQAQTTITKWTFENLAITNYSPNPAPGLNNCVGAVSVSAFGMDIYATPGIGTNDPDILQGAGGDSSTAAKGGNGITNLSKEWRVRGQVAGNGWSSQAPVGTQGVQFNVDTTGFTNLTVDFDWYLTKAGEANLQFEYTTNGSVWINLPLAIPAAQSGNSLQLIDNTSGADANSVQGYYVNCLPTSGGQQWFTNLTATISDPLAANDPGFGIRIVNASTGASCVDGTGGALNNSSGNWRFDNITFSGASSGAVLMPPVITVSSNATVDAPFTNTFSDNSNWRNNFSGIKINGSTLPASAYAVSAGTIIFTPAASALLQRAGTISISISATNYSLDTYGQSIAPGAARSLTIFTQPVAPTGNGGTFVVQPILTIFDQYGNLATNCSATYIASASSGWNFGPGSGVAQSLLNGSVVFTNLSATNATAISGATITFNANDATGLGNLSFTTTNSTTFNLPAPATSGFTAGNLAVLQEDVASKNSTMSILELSPTLANQSSPVNTFAISATGTNALRQSSAGTTGRLADSNDGTLVSFTGFEDGSSATSDETTVNPRGVGTLDAHGNFILQTSYIGDGSVSQNQTRSATSLDDTNWFIGDKGGIYTNGLTTPWIGGSGSNVRSLKSFGGTIYGLQQFSSSLTATVLQMIYVNGGAQELYPVDGFPEDGNVLDFFMVQSGNNGTNYDTVYYIDGTNNLSGAIFKYYLNGTDDNGFPAYSLAGSVTTTNGGDGLTVATNAGGGFDIYYTTGSGGTAGNSLVKVHDSAAWNEPPVLTSTNILYTAPAQATLKGVAFAPVSTNAAQIINPILPITINPNSFRLTGSGAAASAGFSFTNAAGLSFSILATNNLAAPKTNWPVIGMAVENPSGSGHYQFSDPDPATNSTRYYILRQP